MTQTEEHALDLHFYTLDELEAICSRLPRLRLSEEVEGRIAEGAEYVRSIAGEDRHIYGINTGFGSLCERRVPLDGLSELQHNQLLSHACGVGPPVPPALSRAVLLVKLLTFRGGHSGISLAVVDRLLAMWNGDVLPAIPKKGTVGASGDLAPLAHAALPLIGLGEVWIEGRLVPAAEALAARGWEPLVLGPKEGLALTNGVQYINAYSLLHLVRARRSLRWATVIAALSMQGFSTASSFYQELVHATSWHPERQRIAGDLRRLLAGSNHHELPHCNPAQEDPYSFRCMPQVHCAVEQTFGFARQVIENECNSVSDNPLVFPRQRQLLTGGNLHGESTAFAMDFLAIALAELANISERRTYQLLSGQHGLPSFLIAEGGIHSGLMITQYTAAALVNECKVLATPASIDTIPTCQLQEDHVSMGGTSVYKLEQVLDNLETVLAIELLCAMQAIDLNAGMRLSPATAPIHREFRRAVPELHRDRLMSADIESARRFLLASESLAVACRGMA